MQRLRFYSLALIGFFLVIWTVPLRADAKEAPFQSPRQQQPIRFEISLLTFSPTDHLFEWFGHTALAVKDFKTGRSVAYNFGGFSFGIDDFLMFSMGRFVFWSYTGDTQRVIKRYRHRGRHIVIQKLDLTRSQALTIRHHLRRAVLPQNRFYIYDHFKDNCATRLRDIVDSALGGAIQEQSKDQTGHSIRNYIDRMTFHQPALNFLLNFVLSDGVDQKITYWDTMFLPDRQMAVFQEVINPVTGRPLVKERNEIISAEKSRFFEGQVTIPKTGNGGWIFGLVFVIVAAGSAWFYVSAGKSVGRDSIKRISGKIYPAIAALFGGVFGLLGLILFFMAVIASHKDVYWNENFFLLNPITFTLLPLGIMRIFGRARTLFAAVSMLCSAAAVFGVCAKVIALPALNQDNWQQIQILLPILIVIGIVGVLDLRQQALKRRRHQG